MADPRPPDAILRTRPRARDLGIPLPGRPGTHNAITDVPGVEVGVHTMISGNGPLRVGAGPVRTGVTAILPRGWSGVGQPCVAGWFSLNGNGEMTGTAWIDEAGTINLPVLLTNTHAVGPCHRGVIDWVMAHQPALTDGWLLPVVAETWDGYLNDINGRHVTAEHAIGAINAASSGPVPEGSVGGGTGMNCYAFKGGTGSASRLVVDGSGGYTVGVLLQANFGSRAELTVAGVPVGQALREDDPLGEWAAAPSGAGSVIAVVATDAPLLPGQCKALARRVPLGLARTGTTGSHYSGDLFLAFSTADPGVPTAADQLGSNRFVPWGRMDPFYAAVVEAVEEATLNALTGADTMVGRDGHRTPGLPLDRLRDSLRDWRVPLR